MRDRPVPVVINSGPEFPDVLDYLWRWFQEISLGLSPNGFSAPVITWEALRAWQALTDTGPLEPWEARALVQLGMVRAGVLSERSNDKPPRTDTERPTAIGSARPPPRAASAVPMRLPSRR